MRELTQDEVHATAGGFDSKSTRNQLYEEVDLWVPPAQVQSGISPPPPQIPPLQCGTRIDRSSAGNRFHSWVYCAFKGKLSSHLMPIN